MATESLRLFARILILRKINRVCHSRSGWFVFLGDENEYCQSKRTATELSQSVTDRIASLVGRAKGRERKLAGAFLAGTGQAAGVATQRLRLLH
jgi:hypothetical protein